MLSDIVKRYGLAPSSLIEPFGTGLINNTWVVTENDKRYILQRINTEVFRVPEAIAFNLKALNGHFQENSPDYLFVKPLATTDGNELVLTGEGKYFRLFPFIEGSCTYDTVNSVALAYEAAKQFGRFTRLLSGFDSETLKNTIPDFHNLPLRYEQFLDSIHHGDPKRIIESKESIDFLQAHKNISDDFSQLVTNNQLKKRVTHHDTKISNVLFDKNDKGLCVIDLDTVMSGYFISDVGDMMRTYLSPVSEEENALGLINIREEYFRAIVEGYLQEMRDILSAAEKKLFIYAGKYMIYMQALRFLTDHLNLDRYYGAKYPGHNFNRAKNQIVLLQDLTKKEPALAKQVEAFL